MALIHLEVYILFIYKFTDSVSQCITATVGNKTSKTMTYSKASMVCMHILVNVISKHNIITKDVNVNKILVV